MILKSFCNMFPECYNTYVSPCIVTLTFLFFAMQRDAPKGGVAMTNEQLVADIQSGRATKEKMQLLYDNNCTLIRKFIKPYISEVCEEADLMQEAFIGLMEAVEKYDCNKETRFMTYARWWIAQYVRDYARRMSCFYIPQNIYEKIGKYSKALSKYRQEYGHNPTHEEMSEITGLTEKEINMITFLLTQPVSLDAPAGKDDNDILLSDLVPNDQDVEGIVVDKAMNDFSKERIWKIAENKTNAQQYNIIVELYQHGLTLSQIAANTGISLERVRQIKAEALRKLRLSRQLQRIAEDMEILGASSYRCGISKFRHSGSTVEFIAIREAELQQALDVGGI